jgi:hypothetical protein
VKPEFCLTESTIFFTENSQLTILNGTITVCCNTHLTSIHTLSGNNVELVNVKAGGMYSYRSVSNIEGYNKTEYPVYFENKHRYISMDLT